MAVNTVFVVGNAGGNPEEIAKGAGARVSICVDNGYMGKDGWVEKPSWLEVKAWDRGENKIGGRLYDKVRKGDRILVQGKLVEETWETDAGKRSKIVIEASSFQVLSEGKGGGNGGSSRRPEPRREERDSGRGRDRDSGRGRDRGDNGRARTGGDHTRSREPRREEAATDPFADVPLDDEPAGYGGDDPPY
jgi:single-stranded DNA-binding protein